MARAVALVATLLVGLSPGSADAEADSRLFPHFKDETGVLRLAQVVALAPRQMIVDAGSSYSLLLGTGIPDEHLGDGRIAIARVYCCGGLTEESEAIWVFVPPGATAETGDVIEVRMGRSPDELDPGAVNSLVAVRQHGGIEPDGPCRWLPDDPSLWLRILYCDEIELQGWVRQKTFLREMWFKPAATAAAVESPTAEPAPTPATEAPSEEPTGSATTPAPASPDSDAVPTNAAPPAATAILVLIDPSLQKSVREAAAASTPPLGVMFEGEPAAESYAHRLGLHFDSVVDRSRQRRNREGAGAAGLMGWMLGSITPWSCPTTHTLTGVVTNRAGEELGKFAVQKVQKRVGTMLACGEVERPNDGIVRELLAEFLQRLGDEKILPEAVAGD